MNRILVVMEINTSAFVPEVNISGAPEILDAILVDALKDGGVSWCTISKIPQRVEKLAS